MECKDYVLKRADLIKRRNRPPVDFMGGRRLLSPETEARLRERFFNHFAGHDRRALRTAIMQERNVFVI